MHIRGQVILMKCSDFEKYMLENGSEDIGGTSADEHRKTCDTCGALYSELLAVSMVVKSMDREPAPIGFDARLKSRIAAEQAVNKHKGLAYQFKRMISVFTDATTRKYALAPILAVLVLFAILFGTNLIPVSHNNKVIASDTTDWAYIKACKNAHASISAEDPFADKSAQLLQSNTFDTGQEL